MTTTELADSLNQFISELGSNDNSDKQIDSILKTIDEALASGMGQMVIQEEASKAFGYDPNISLYIRLYLNGDRGQSNRLRGYIKQSLEGGNFTLSFFPTTEAVGAVDVTETPHLVSTDSSRIGIANADRFYPRDASGVVSSVAEGTKSDVSISSERFLSEPAEIHKPLNMSELNKKLSSLPKQAQFSIVNSIANKFGTEIAYIMQNALQEGRKMNFSAALKEEVERLVEEHSEPEPQNIQISIEKDTPVSVVKTIADMPVDMAAAVVADVELCPTCGKLVAEKLADAVITNKIELPEDIKDKEDDIAVIIENAGSSKPYPTEFSVIKSCCYNKYHRVFSELPKDLFGGLIDDNDDGGGDSDDIGGGFGSSRGGLNRHGDEPDGEGEPEEAEETEKETRVKKVAKKIAKLDTKDQDKVLLDMEDKIGSKAASEVRKEAESIEEEFDLTEEDEKRADEFIKATGADVGEIEEQIEEEIASTPEEPEEADTEDTEDIPTDGEPEEEPTLEREETTDLEEDDADSDFDDSSKLSNAWDEEEPEPDSEPDFTDDEEEEESTPEPESDSEAEDVTEEDETEEEETSEDESEPEESEPKDEEEDNGEEDAESEDEDEGESESDEDITDEDIEEGFDEGEDDDEEDDDSIENKKFSSYRFRRNFARQFSRGRMTRFSRLNKWRRLGRNFSDHIADNTEIDRYADQYCARKPEVAKGEFVDLLRAKAKCLKSGSDKDCQTYEKLKGNFNMKYGYKPKDGWVGRRGSKHFSRHTFNFTQALDMLDPEKASAVLTIVGKQCGNVVSDAILAMSLTNHSKSKHFSDIADDMLPAGCDQDEIQEVLQDSIDEVSDVEEPMDLFSGTDRIAYLKNLSLFSCALYSDAEDEIDADLDDIDADIDDIDTDVEDIDADIDDIDEGIDDMEFARRRSRFGRSRSRSRYGFGRGRGSYRMFADKDEDEADEKPAKKEEKKSECKGEDCEGCPECDPEKAKKAEKKADEKKADDKADKKEEKAEPKKAEKKADEADKKADDDAEPVSLSAVEEEEDIDVVSDGAEADYVEDTTAMPDVPYVADADDEDALPLPEGDYIDDDGDPADSEDDGILPYGGFPEDVDDDDDTIVTDEEIEANFSKYSSKSESGIKEGIDLYDYILGGAKEK